MIPLWAALTMIALLIFMGWCVHKLDQIRRMPL